MTGARTAPDAYVHADQKRRKHAPPQAPSMQAAYDPAVPNDYTYFKTWMRERRRHSTAYSHDYGEDMPEEGPDTRDYNRFAPPPSYVNVVFSKDRHGEGKSPSPQPPGPPPQTPPVLEPRLPPGPPPRPPPGLVSKQPTEPTAAQGDIAPSMGAISVAEKRRSAAAAIAAQFSRPSEAPHPQPNFAAPVAQPDPAGFAERLMAKYGYKQGEGLGAEGNKGITTPLQAARAGKQGAIINQHGDDRNDAAQRYGHPSEVIVLENVGVEDRELPQEIAAAASKQGIVQRVTVHTGLHGTRVFVCFSGIAGAYRAVREFDGMHFRGNCVASRYYSLQVYESGNYTM